MPDPLPISHLFCNLLLVRPQVLDDDGKKQRFRKVIVKHQQMAESSETTTAETEVDCGPKRGETTTDSRGNRRPKAWSKSKLRISDNDLRSGHFGCLHV